MYYPVLDRQTLWENLHIYILLTFIFLVITIFVYIKLSFPFWNIQPVFHSYDFWRYGFSEPYIIQPKIPFKTKYCDFNNIKTIEYLELDVEADKTNKTPIKAEIIDLLQCHYLPSENAIFLFHKLNLDAYFKAHLSPAYISYYKEIFFPNIKTPSFINDDKKVTGCITSRPIELTINNIKTNIYYIDFICASRGPESTNLSRKLLQTHDYRIRFKEDIKISLIRKEGDPYSGVTSFIKHTSLLISVPPLDKVLPKLPPHFVLCEIVEANFNIFIDFMNEQKRFEIFGQASFGNLLELVKARIIYIYCVKHKAEIHCMYFIRDSRTQYEIGNMQGPVLHLFGSIQNSNSQELFICGWLHTLVDILKTTNVFKFILIDDIAYNFILLETIDEGSVLMKIPVNYYCYNYFVPIRNCVSRECLFLL